MTALPEGRQQPGVHRHAGHQEGRGRLGGGLHPGDELRQGGRHDARAGQGPHQGRGLSQAGLLQAGGKAAQQNHRQEGGRGLQRGGDFVPDQPGKCPEQPV